MAFHNVPIATGHVLWFTYNDFCLNFLYAMFVIHISPYFNSSDFLLYAGKCIKVLQIISEKGLPQPPPPIFKDFLFQDDVIFYSTLTDDMHIVFKTWRLNGLHKTLNKYQDLNDWFMRCWFICIEISITADSCVLNYISRKYMDWWSIYLEYNLSQDKSICWMHICTCLYFPQSTKIIRMTFYSMITSKFKTWRASGCYTNLSL